VAFFLGALLTIAPGPLDGTFLTLDECRDPRVWEADFELMELAGFHTVVIREVVDLTTFQAFYPTTNPGLANNCAYDRVGTVMSLAARHGMKVYLGLAFGAGTSSPPPGHDRDALLYTSAEVARDLITMYGESPSFAGWYLTPEVVVNDWAFNRNHHKVWFHYELVGAIRQFDSHPIASAPYVIPDSTWQPVSPAQMREFATNYVLQTGVNIVMLQDGAGADNRPLEKIAAYFQAAAEGLAWTGAQFWADVEAFRVAPDGQYVPADGEWVAAQSRVVDPVVAATVTWTFQHYMSPNSGRLGAKDAFIAYLTQMLPRN
jgi:Domain of unknown function (DUF4434)